MKLYTEEDLIKAIAFGFGICRKESRAPFNKEMIEFIGALEPTKNIELPSDEEIDKEAFQVPYDNTRGFYDLQFIKGAKWMRSKIQGGNK